MAMGARPAFFLAIKQRQRPISAQAISLQILLWVHAEFTKKLILEISWENWDALIFVLCCTYITLYNYAYIYTYIRIRWLYDLHRAMPKKLHLDWGLGQVLQHLDIRRLERSQWFARQSWIGWLDECFYGPHFPKKTTSTSWYKPCHRRHRHHRRHRLMLLRQALVVIQAQLFHLRGAKPKGATPQWKAKRSIRKQQTSDCLSKQHH